jgi:hypothetical protein
MELYPIYQSKSQVQALKIAAIEWDYIKAQVEGRETNWSATLLFENGFSPKEISNQFIKINQPKVGGYWLLHKNHHEGYMDAEEFEERYERVE